MLKNATCSMTNTTDSYVEVKGKTAVTISLSKQFTGKVASTSADT